jgi:glycosyltransferase involved in cell wall biosynthesis
MAFARAAIALARADRSPVLAETPASSTTTIFLCTLNGARFLQEQLDSIVAQTHTNWRLIVSDDGSEDGTLDILERYGRKFKAPQSVEVRAGPRRGASANFLSLMSDPEIEGTYFACCDQDDVWLPDKLERALAWLESVPTHAPAVYFSRTSYIAADGREIGLSPLFRKPPAFRNALVQSIGGGNTMAFNRAAHDLLVRAGPVHVACHDWWTYLLISGAGGRVHYDPVPSLAYRQHDRNQIGANMGFRARLARVQGIFAGQLRAWFNLHAAALLASAHLLTPENRKLLVDACAMRSASFIDRIRAWRQIRLYRQTFCAQLGIIFAVLTSKI